MTVNNVYFMQHGLAVNKAENPERPLSKQGLNHTRAIARHFKSCAMPISKIFHSGKLRALQTAEIIASEYNITTTTLDYLSPNDDISTLLENLQTNHVLYIGHLPFLEKLLSSLIGENENEKLIQFQNSGVVCLECHNGQYSIKWYLTPELVNS